MNINDDGTFGSLSLYFFECCLFVVVMLNSIEQTVIL